MQDAEGENATGPQGPAGGPRAAVQIVEVGQARAAGHAVVGSIRRPAGDVAGQVPDTERGGGLGIPCQREEPRREIQAGDLRAAPGQLTGQAPVPAGDVEHPEACYRPGQAEQHRQDRVLG
jgi:hypothetical protein